MITFIGHKHGAAGVDKGLKVSHARKFIFHFNGGESGVAVLNRTELPEINDSSPDDATLKVSSISVSEPMEGDGVKSGKYEVTVTYSRTGAGGASSDKGTAVVPPWEMPPYDISFNTSEYVMAFQKAYDLTKPDVNGVPTIPVLNSAGDPFEDSMVENNVIMKFSYNLQTFNPNWLLLYVNRVNKDAETVLDIGLPARHCRIKTLSASKQKQFNPKGELLYEYWVVGVEIEISPKPMHREIMERGLFFKNSTGKYRIFIRTDSDPHNTGINFGKKEDMGTDPSPCDEPQRLTDSGGLLDNTGCANNTVTIYKSYHDKYELSWSPLNLPKSSLGDS